MNIYYKGIHASGEEEAKESEDNSRDWRWMGLIAAGNACDGRKVVNAAMSFGVYGVDNFQLLLNIAYDEFTYCKKAVYAVKWRWY